MGSELRQIISGKFFLLGLVLKLYFIFSITPEIVNNFYIPFFDYSINNYNFIDPWTAWINVNSV